jgi:FMN phosphatase YigB (HAD superfamily)
MRRPLPAGILAAHNSKAMPQPIQLVGLDLGGVLIRVCRDWREACEAAKLEVPRHAFDPEMTRRLGEINRQHESGRIDEAEFERQAAALTGLTPQQVAAAAAGWLRPVYPGAFDLVGRLAAAQPRVRSACLSNTNTRHWRMMNTPGPHQLGLDRLTYRFVSFEIGHMKPSAEIFRHVERQAGFPPTSILFFDDNPDNVAAARAAGWHAQQIDPDRDPPAQVREHLRGHGVEV